MPAPPKLPPYASTGLLPFHLHCYQPLFTMAFAIAAVTALMPGARRCNATLTIYSLLMRAMRHAAGDDIIDRWR